MQLSKYSPLFGFNLLEFSNLLDGATLFGYKYNGFWVGNLLQFTSIDHCYIYEDEDIALYYPTKCKPKSRFFFKLKKKYILLENDRFIFSTNFYFSNYTENIPVMLVEITDKVSEKTDLRYYCTIDYNISWLKKFKKEEYFKITSQYSPIDAMIQYGNYGEKVNALHNLNLDILFKILETSQKDII